MPERKNQPTVESSQLRIRELAKQGNPKAIAALMNRLLQPKGVTAKVALKPGCLQVIIESAQVPSTEWVAVIRRGLLSLGITSIKQVKVYGRQVGKAIPAWSQEFNLVPLSQSKPSVINPSTPLENHPAQVSKTVPIPQTQAENSRIQSSPTPQTINPKKNVVLIFLRLIFGVIGLLGLIKTLIDLVAIILNEPLARATLYDSRQLVFFILTNLLIVTFSCIYICISLLLRGLLIQAPRFLTIILVTVTGYSLILFLFDLAKLTIVAGKATSYEFWYLIGIGSFLLVNCYLLYKVQHLSFQLNPKPQKTNERKTQISRSTQKIKTRKTR